MGWLQNGLRRVERIIVVETLPRGNVIHLGLTKRAALRHLSDAGDGGRSVRGPSHDVGQDLMEEIHNVPVDLLELQKECIVALGALNALQARVRDPRRNLLLLGKGKQSIRLDTQDQSGLLDLGKGFVDWVGRFRVGTVPGHVVSVQLAGHGNVTVGVEPLDKLLALVAKVRLSREISWRARPAGRISPRLGGGWGRERLGPGELGIHVLDVRLWDGRVLSAFRTRGQSSAVAIIMNGPMLIGRRRELLLAIDVLAFRGIGHVTTESRLKRVATAVGKQCRHTGCPKTSSGRVIKRIVAVVVFGVRVDTLALSLAPTDTPCGVTRRRRDGHNGPDIVSAKECIFQGEHATHGPADYCCDLLHAKIVQDKLVDTAGY